MESTSLRNESGRGKRYNEEEGIVPTSPNSPPNTPNHVVRAPKCPRWGSLAKTQRNRANMPNQQKWRLAEASHF